MEGCAFNYTGSKLRYKEYIEKVLPQEENLKVLEPFAGGFSLCSMYKTSWTVTANDIIWQLIDLHREFQTDLDFEDVEGTLLKTKNLCHSWIDASNKSDPKAYIALRDAYNDTKNVELLYALICSSFSNQIRFNSDGDFNLPKGNRYFNPSMQKKLRNYLEALNRVQPKFVTMDFRDFRFSSYDLLVVDPPYVYDNKSNASYNENGGWGLRDLVALLTKLDKASNNGTKFIFFNEIITKGEDNPVIQEWVNKYNVTILKDTMTGCNYQRTKDRSVEVMVTNY